VDRAYAEPTVPVKLQVLRHVGVMATEDNCNELFNTLEAARRTNYAAVLRFRVQHLSEKTFSSAELAAILISYGKSAHGSKHALQQRVRVTACVLAT